jgi:hypothetical protein
MATNDDSTDRTRLEDRKYFDRLHERRLSATLTMLGALAVFLYVLPLFTKLHGQLESLSQAVADALVVSVIVSLAVEPRLLRYFGEELKSFGQQLGTQTFWASFYSRAPEIYIDAIKSLAEAEQFAISSNWVASFEWANDDKSVLRLQIEHAYYRENRSSKEFPVFTRTFIYESSFAHLKSEIRSHALVCEAIEYYSDLIKDGHVRAEYEDAGILRIHPSNNTAAPYFKAPPGARFTVLTTAETYVPAIGHFPLVVNVPTLRLTIQLKGNALSDLYISIQDASIGMPTHGRGNELAANGPIKVGEVFITGQAVLLSWASGPYTQTCD